MQIVNYSNQKPPVYDKCVELFGANWDRGTIFTYGDTVHCKYDIPDHLKVHEQAHVRQQLAMGKEKWWERYFIDQAFRLHEEIEAYQAQIAFAKEHMNRLGQRKLKKDILWDLIDNHDVGISKEEAEKILYGK